MADNTTLNTMTGGDVIAADDISGVKYQRVKIALGADGVNDGDVASANALPVKLTGEVTAIETSTTPLNNGVSYTTAWFDTSTLGHGFTLAMSADQGGTLYHEESPDAGTNIVQADSRNYLVGEMSAGVDEEHISHARYSRFKFTNNSGSNQTAFIFTVVQRNMDVFGTVKIAPDANEVSQGADAPWTFEGTRGNNTAIPGTSNLGVVPAVATAAAPTHTEGNMVCTSTTLTGDTRVTLDGELVVLGAGSAAIGKLAANSGVDIGDVDITSIAAGDNNIGNVDVVSLPSLVLSAGSAAIGKLAANSGVDIGDVDVLSLPTLANVTTVATVTTLTGGAVAHDTTDSGNPIKVGGRAESSLAGMTLVADGDRIDFCGDLDGVLHVRPYTASGDTKYARIADTAGSAAAVTNFGAVASTRNYVTTIAIYNSSATGGYVDFTDGSGGTIIFTAPAPAAGGSVITFPVPLRQPTANTALYYDVSAALTTVYISVVGFQSKL